METEKILRIVLREMTAYGHGWRMDWSDFDGRTLRNQLDDLAKWAIKAQTGQTDEEYTEGSEFSKEQTE